MFCAIINLVFAFWHSFTRGARWHLCDLHLVRVETACVPIWFTYESVDGAPMGCTSPVSSLPGLGIRSSVWVHRQSYCTPFYTVHTHTHTHTPQN